MLTERETKIAVLAFELGLDMLAQTADDTGLTPTVIRAVITGEDGWELRLKHKLETEAGF